MKKILILMIIAIFTIGLVGCSYSEKSTDTDFIANSISVSQKEYLNDFDSYELKETENGINITGFFETNMNSAVSKTSQTNEGKMSTVYDLNYDYSAEVINVVFSSFDKEDEFLGAQVFTAYPIRFLDGTFDALIIIEDKHVYLSEILSGEIVDCFALTIGFGAALLAKIAAAALVAAKVAAVVTGVVLVGAVSVQVIELSKDKIKEREREAEKELAKSLKNPRYYYPAVRKSGKLLIAAFPVGLIQASQEIVKGLDFWSAFDHTAKKLAVFASGGAIGPEFDADKPGYYKHYHLLHRAGGHSFFGMPAKGVY